MNHEASKGFQDTNTQRMVSYMLRNRRWKLLKKVMTVAAKRNIMSKFVSQLSTVEIIEVCLSLGMDDEVIWFFEYISYSVEKMLHERKLSAGVTNLSQAYYAAEKEFSRARTAGKKVLEQQLLFIFYMRNSYSFYGEPNKVKDRAKPELLLPF